MWLDKIPLWGGQRGDHVSLRQLADDFAQYLYLPRIQNLNVLLDGVQNGVALLTWEQDAFAYASATTPTRAATVDSTSMKSSAFRRTVWS